MMAHCKTGPAVSAPRCLLGPPSHHQSSGRSAQLSPVQFLSVFNMTLRRGIVGIGLRSLRKPLDFLVFFCVCLIFSRPQTLLPCLPPRLCVYQMIHASVYGSLGLTGTSLPSLPLLGPFFCNALSLYLLLTAYITLVSVFTE